MDRNPSIETIMTRTLSRLEQGATAADAAREMANAKVGDVLVVDGQGSLCGMVTDRDLVVRVLGQGRDPASTKLVEICSKDIASLQPSSTVDDAVSLMRQRAVRRVPVCENGKPVGVVSIGDLARLRDPNSVLAQISDAPPSN